MVSETRGRVRAGAAYSSGVNNDPVIFRLMSPGGFIACSARVETDGVPRQRFRKEIIKVGDYVDSKTGRPFTVTPEAMTHWPAVFSRMRSNGIKIPIPIEGHVDDDVENKLRIEDPTIKGKNAGWVEDMFSVGDSLHMVCELIGSEAILAAARNDVSIKSPAKWKDGKGNEYVRPITHVAICPDPLIPGLGEFIPLAASRGKPMSKIADLLKACGVTDAVTAENTDSLIERAIAGVSKKVDPPAAPAVTASQGGEKKTPDPILVKTVAELRRTKLDGLVTAGKITPTVRDSLAKSWIGENNAAIVASISAGNPGDDFDSVIAAFTANDPIKLGEKSGAQVGTLENSGAGGGASKSPLVADAEQRAKAAQGR